MFVGEGAGDVVDRSAGDAGFVEALDPVGGWVGAGALVDGLVEGGAVLGAAGGGGVVGVVDEVVGVEGAAEAGEHGAAGGGDVDVSVGGFVDAGGHEGGVVVAGLGGDFGVDGPAGGLEVEHGDLGFEEGGVDPLAFAGAFAFEEGDEDGLGEEVAGGEVGDGDADADGAVAGESVDGHDAAEALGDLVDAGAPGVGAVLAEAGDAAVDDAGVAGAAGGVVDAEAAFDVGAVVLDDDVGALDEGEEDVDGLGLLEVEGEGALVAVEVEEVGGLAGAGDAFGGAGRGGVARP